jgi:tRNA A37 methylthiotransferase MiaB
VKELVLVSENSSSYGKDIGAKLEDLLAALNEVDAAWVRVSYLQPAEVRPALVEAMCAGNALPYFDIPFQHASAQVLRRMRRFGDPDSFLDLVSLIRRADPAAGLRSNFIVGFPGETEGDLRQLADFIGQARLDAIGVFGYSREEGTEGATLPGQLPQDEIDARVDWIAGLVDELVAQRAAERIGEPVQVLVEEAGTEVSGRARFQGPQTDGNTVIRTSARRSPGDLVWGMVVASDGVDLVAEEV